MADGDALRQRLAKTVHRIAFAERAERRGGRERAFTERLDRMATAAPRRRKRMSLPGDSTRRGRGGLAGQEEQSRKGAER